MNRKTAILLLTPNLLWFVLLLSISSYLMVACSTSESNASIKEKIRKQNDILHKVIDSKNVNLLNDVYAKEAWYMAPGYSCITSVDSIKLMWADGIESLSNMKSTTLALYGKDDLVTEVGIVEITVKGKDSTYIHRAKYNNVWEIDEKGDYRLKVDIWNALTR